MILLVKKCILINEISNFQVDKFNLIVPNFNSQMFHFNLPRHTVFYHKCKCIFFWFGIRLKTLINFYYTREDFSGVCRCCLPCNHCSTWAWTWVVEIILAYGNVLHSTQCGEFHYTDPLISNQIKNKVSLSFRLLSLDNLILKTYFVT